MILFPNAKINLGLDIIGRRDDGYHDISTVMIPVGWHDILEIGNSPHNGAELFVSGRALDCDSKNNLVIKAYEALASFTGGLPGAKIYLDKHIPDGAGMGGGSADAAFTIKGLNDFFNLGLSRQALAAVASTVGADCAFFIYNEPALCQGIGDVITTGIKPACSGLPILIAKPQVSSVSTRLAYANATIHASSIDLKEVVQSPIATWKDTLTNSFESSIFPIRPEIKELKNKIYDFGALYASMTGSGAAVFGIFDNDKLAQTAYENLADCDKIVTTMIN